MGFHEDEFKRYLVSHRFCTEEGAKWAVIWVGKFLAGFPDWNDDREKAILGFERSLAFKKPPETIARAVKAVKYFMVFMDAREKRPNAGKKISGEGGKSEVVRSDEKMKMPAPALPDREDAGKSLWREFSASMMAQVRELIRLKHHSIRTEKTYLAWTRRFLDFVEKRKLADVVDNRPQLTAEHVRTYLAYLAAERRVSAATQEQALNALLVLYRTILHIEIDGLSSVLRAKKRHRLPVVLSRDEIGRLLKNLQQPYRMMASIMYGAGLRLEECLSLRVKDINFDNGSIEVRSGKGGKDRMTVLPQALVYDLKEYLRELRLHWEEARKRDLPGVFFRRLWGRSILLCLRNGAGTGSFLPAAQARIPEPDKSRSGIFILLSCRKKSGRAYRWQELINWLQRILCGIALLLICWKTGMIFGLSRNCLVIRMSRQP